MNKLNTILSLLLLITFNAYVQINEVELYRKAYNYLQEKVAIDAKTFNKNCERIVKGAKVKIQPNLQVASKFIDNNRGFPLCDLLKKKYKITESCVYAIGSGEFELTTHVQDSLQQFWKNYDSNKKIQLNNLLTDMISKNKDGFQVFFSDIYENTLAAEVKSFCIPYDEDYWYGSSTSYFFVFNDESELIEVYSGITIHYN